MVLALRGRRNLDQGEETVTDADLAAALRRRARVLLAQAGALTALAALPLLLLG